MLGPGAVHRVSVSIGKDWVRTEVGFRVRANAMCRVGFMGHFVALILLSILLYPY